MYIILQWQYYVYHMISNFIQVVENKLSQWFCQGIIVDKYIQSIQYYEEKLNYLKEAIKSVYRSELRKQPAFCNMQSLLLSPAVKRHNIIDTLSNDKKKRNLKRQNFVNNFEKLLRNIINKLFILGLVIQVIVTPTTGAYVSEQNSKSETDLSNPSAVLDTQKRTIQTFVKNATQDFKLLPNSTHDELLTLKSKLKQNTVNFKNKDSTNKTKMYTASINSADYKVNRRIEINRELQQKILYQFDNINDDLEELIKALHADESNELLVSKSSQSVLYRIIRSLPPFNQRQICRITKDKLIELDDTIRDALTNVNITQRGTNCELSSKELNNGNNDNCDKILKSMQCAVDHLKNGFIQAKLSSKSLEYIKLKNAYDDLCSKFNTIMDEVKQEFTQKYKQRFDTLNTDYQELKKALDNAIIELKENLEHLIISELSHGHIELAVHKFKVLADTSLLSHIIRTAYTDYGQMNNFDNIDNFICNLPWLSHYTIAYETLYEIMDKKNPKLCVLDEHIKVIEVHFICPYKEPDKKELSDRLHYLSNKLETCKTTLTPAGRAMKQLLCSKSA